jgi:hypothetical protein
MVLSAGAHVNLVWLLAAACYDMTEQVYRRLFLATEQPDEVSHSCTVITTYY